MSERKVLSKYYPPDFDPAALTKRRKKGKEGAPKLQTVRLMMPMPIRCTRCGEFMYKGRKFNARKEKPEDANYLGIQIYNFYIRCTRCSGEIIFRTDPKNQDYAIVSGAKRNVEPWRQTIDETDEQRLDRLEKEQAEEGGEVAAEQNRMEELEAKTLEAKREMDVADALDEIRTRNARIARADHREHLETVALNRPSSEEELLRQQEEEDAQAAREAFAAARAAAMEEDVEVPEVPAEAPIQPESAATAAAAQSTPDVPASKPEAPAPPTQSFKIQARKPKKKTDLAAKLGIKIKK